MSAKKIKCVIFDCDGVLVDSEVISNKVLVDMANALGAELDYNTALEMFRGKSMGLCMELIEARIDHVLPSDFEKNIAQKPLLHLKKILSQLME